jgi:energy-coupling factor transporter ATP-binding protein EcfA2
MSKTADKKAFDKAAAAAILDEEVSDGPKAASNGVPPPAPKQPNPVRLLSRYIATVCDLVHDNGRAYAVPRTNEGDARLEGYPAGVAIPFGAELRRIIVRAANRGGLPPISEGTARMVQLQLEAKAFEKEATSLALRFYDDGDRVVLDLGRKDGQTIVITAESVCLEKHVPKGVVFRRSHAIRPLPIPEPGGKLEDLAPLLALEKDSEQFRALLGWDIGLPFVRSVRPGILAIGAPGSGKSTRLRLAASIVEPTSEEDFGKHFGRSPDDDEVRALHRAVPFWDNVSALSQIGSDHLCVLITGTAREGRQLYTNDEISTAAVKRPIALTAVATPAGLRPDALDRLIIFQVGTPDVRLADDEVQRRFDEAHPKLLGAWCEAVSAILRWRPKVTAPGSYRMAAHAHNLAALDAAVAAGDLKGCPGGLLDAYNAAHIRVQQQTAADDTFGGALIEFLEKMPITVVNGIQLPDDVVRAQAIRNGSGQLVPLMELTGTKEHVWKGHAKDLLSNYQLVRPGRDAPGWPTSARGLPVVLNQLKEPLAAVGVTWVSEEDPHAKSSRYTITLSDK